MRGRDEHHKYTFSNFDINITSNGKKYVEFMKEEAQKLELVKNKTEHSILKCGKQLATKQMSSSVISIIHNQET